MPLKAGVPAPPFTAPDQEGRDVTLESLAGRHVVLYFYPHDHTPICTVEACTFEDQLDDFERLGVPVLGVSADSVGSHKRFAERHKLSFRLLADPERRMIKAYKADGLLGRVTRVTYILSPEGMIAGVHRAELSGKGHAAWAKAKLDELGVRSAVVDPS